MSLNYHKGNEEHSNDSFWTSYSDLFLGLSCIFLLLYVVSSMRQGADVIEQQILNEHLSTEVSDLKNQLKAYEAIKDQYMKDQASASEKDEYNELIDKLSLLREENQSENDKLKQALLNNKNKEASLNKYQQMVRNVINANKMAKTKINTREDVIEEKTQVIGEKEIQVQGLEKEVESNKQLIARGERQILEAKEKLATKIKQLKKSFKENKITRVILEKRIAQANNENGNKIKALINEKQQYQNDLNNVTKKLQTVAQNLDETKGLLDKKTGEAELLQDKVVQTAEEAAKKIAGLKASFSAQQARERTAFEKELGNVKIGAAEKERRERAFRSAALQKEKDMNQQIQDMSNNLSEAKGMLDRKTGEAEMLQGKLAQTEGQMAQKIADLKNSFGSQQARERAAFEGELNKMKVGAAERERRERAFREAAGEKERSMNQQLQGMQGELQKAKSEIEARRSVAKNIGRSFADAGIKAEVDGETGEVTLDFGESYFDSGSAQLKAEMKSVIERAVPIYAKSLLGNAKISDKVSSVEIIGFASPTYKGRFVDPKSQLKEDQEALKYNMDLSYSRAKSIFNYIVDNQKDQTTSHKSLMSLMKVSGRSFLEVAKVKTDVSPDKFCKVNDCKKAQRVVIRFNMDPKK